MYFGFFFNCCSSKSIFSLFKGKYLILEWNFVCNMVVGVYYSSGIPRTRIYCSLVSALRPCYKQNSHSWTRKSVEKVESCAQLILILLQLVWIWCKRCCFVPWCNGFHISISSTSFIRPLKVILHVFFYLLIVRIHENNENVSKNRNENN